MIIAKSSPWFLTQTAYLLDDAVIIYSIGLYKKKQRRSLFCYFCLGEPSVRVKCAASFLRRCDDLNRGNEKTQLSTPNTPRVHRELSLRRPLAPECII